MGAINVRSIAVQLWVGDDVSFFCYLFINIYSLFDYTIFFQCISYFSFIFSQFSDVLKTSEIILNFSKQCSTVKIYKNV